MNPANQKGSGIFLSKTKGLFIGTISGKSSFSSGNKPKFKDALIATILHIPSFVKCSLFSVKLNACLKSKKSHFFSVINGYFSK
jgi:hypothetical protein